MERNADLGEHGAASARDRTAEHREPATHPPVTAAAEGASVAFSNDEGIANESRHLQNSPPRPSSFRQGGRAGPRASDSRAHPRPQAYDAVDAPDMQLGGGGRGYGDGRDRRRGRRDGGGRGRGATFGGNRGVEGSYPHRPQPQLQAQWQLPPHTHTHSVAVISPGWGPLGSRARSSAESEVIIRTPTLGGHITGSPASQMAAHANRVVQASGMGRGYPYPGAPMQQYWLVPEQGLAANGDLQQQWSAFHPQMHWQGVTMLAPHTAMQVPLPHPHHADPWMHAYPSCAAPRMQYPPPHASFYAQMPPFAASQMAHMNPDGGPPRRPPAQNRPNSQGAHPANSYGSPHRWPQTRSPSMQATSSPHTCPSGSPSQPSYHRDAHQGPAPRPPPGRLATDSSGNVNLQDTAASGASVRPPQPARSPSSGGPEANENRSPDNGLSAGRQQLASVPSPADLVATQALARDVSKLSIAPVTQHQHVQPPATPSEGSSSIPAQPGAATASPSGPHPVQLTSTEASEAVQPQQRAAAASAAPVTTSAAASTANMAGTADAVDADRSQAATVGVGITADGGGHDQRRAEPKASHHILAASTDVAQRTRDSSIALQQALQTHRDGGSEVGVAPGIGRMQTDVDTGAGQQGGSQSARPEVQQAAPAAAKKPAWGAPRQGPGEGVAGSSLVERLRADVATGPAKPRRAHTPAGSLGRRATARSAAAEGSEASTGTAPRRGATPGRTGGAGNVDTHLSDSSATTAAQGATNASEVEGSDAAARDLMGRVCASEALQRLVAPPVSQRAAQDADAEMPTLECIGLQNPQYLCFMNACIQAMVGCAPFCKILVDLRGTSELLRAVGAPTLAAFVAFTESLGVLEEGQQRVAQGLRVGNVDMFGDVVEAFNDRRCVQPQAGEGPLAVAAAQEQQDAHEFLEHVIDNLHEETLALRKRMEGGLEEGGAAGEDEGGWLQAGRRKKVAMIHGTQFTAEGRSTSIGAIFRGSSRSTVSCRGSHASSTMQPFTSVSLKLSGYQDTVKGALVQFVKPEKIPDFMSSSGRVEASKQIRFHEAPQVLIVHLLRFKYEGSQSHKISSTVEFDSDLHLPPKMFAEGAPSKQASYSLFAVINHIGTSPAKGHYIAKVKQRHGEWLQFDDSHVFDVPARSVLDGQAYVLLYQKVESH